MDVDSLHPWMASVYTLRQAVYILGLGRGLERHRGAAGPLGVAAAAHDRGQGLLIAGLDRENPRTRILERREARSAHAAAVLVLGSRALEGNDDVGHPAIVAGHRINSRPHDDRPPSRLGRDRADAGVPRTAARQARVRGAGLPV